MSTSIVAKAITRATRSIYPLDPLPTPVGGPLADASLCPTFPTTLSQPDGQYIQAEMDFWFTVNGVTLRNTNGQNFVGTFSQYAGLYAVCGAAD